MTLRFRPVRFMLATFAASALGIALAGGCGGDAETMTGTGGAGGAGDAGATGGGGAGGQGGSGGANADAGTTGGAGGGAGPGTAGAAAGSGGAAGSAGAGGGGGSAGSAGSGGSGGSSGAAGRGGAGGAAGRGGAGGAAGAAGTGGNGGRGGGSGGGAGGRGGASGGAGGRGGAGGAAGTGAGGALPQITVWLAGDSTVADGSAPCPIGWGASFQSLFGNRATVVNDAIAGRSVRTWLYSVESTMDSTGECVLDKNADGTLVLQARWQAMLNATTGMKAGDYLLIQFGINDSDSTCPRHVGIDAFKASYGMMAQAATDRGAHPIFITPTSSISCSGTTAVATRGSFVPATKDAGTQYGVPVIDLNAATVALYNAMKFCPVPGGDVSASTTGPVGDFFCDDHTHFSATGAPQVAALVAQAIRSQGLPLAGYLK